MAAGNVNVVGKADYANREGSTAIASVLHGAAVLLRHSKGWDWFVNLAASDYPLITQDGNMHSSSVGYSLPLPVLNFLPVREMAMCMGTVSCGCFVVWMHLQSRR